ncbi:MAG: hypothetical protein KGL39_06590 [Patescibacteria group bacterium]|nr:hypothetical protein [Patescibacteria group bacterium]
MGTTLVSTVLTRVRNQVNDTGTVQRWPDATIMIPALNDGMLALATLTRDAYLVRKAFQLTAGQAYQKGIVPGDTLRIVDVVRNMGSDGFTPGRVISECTQASMDLQDRDWMRQGPHAPDNDIVNWMRDEDDVQNFFVYPKPSTSVPVWVEIKFTEVPPPVSALTDVIPVLDKYRIELQNFVTGSVLVNDVEAGDQPRGLGLLNLFYSRFNAAPPARAP